MHGGFPGNSRPGDLLAYCQQCNPDPTRAYPQRGARPIQGGGGPRRRRFPRALRSHAGDAPLCLAPHQAGRPLCLRHHRPDPRVRPQLFGPASGRGLGPMSRPAVGCVVFLGRGIFIPVSRYDGYQASSEILRGVQTAGRVRSHREGTHLLLGHLVA